MIYHIHYVSYNNTYTIFTTVGFAQDSRIITLDTNLSIDEVHQLLS